MNPHKLGCRDDPHREFRLEARKNFPQVGIKKPIESMMLREPSEEKDFRCPKCGIGYQLDGIPFHSQKEANECCAYMDTEEFDREVRRKVAIRNREINRIRRGWKCQ